MVMFTGWNGRMNYDIVSRMQNKYLTSKNFNKANHLYGLYENQDFIKDNYVVVVERII